MQNKKNENTILGTSHSNTIPSEDMNMSDLVLSLVNESALLADVLHSSLQLMEIFDLEEMVDCVIHAFQKSCKTEVRFWRTANPEPILLGTQGKPLPQEDLERQKIIERVKQAFQMSKFNVTLDEQEFLCDGGYLMEITDLSEEKINVAYIATLYFRHLIRALNLLKDHLVIAKAFHEIREMLNLKERLEGSLKDIKDQSNSSLSNISANLEKISALAEKPNENKQEIQSLAMIALNETQVGDLTNQKIFASLHNLETLFVKFTSNLDVTSKQYLDSLYQPSESVVITEEVTSSSIIEGKAADQNAVDDLLAELGL